MSPAAASAAKPDAPWRALASISALAALHEIDEIVKARRASSQWMARCQAEGPEGDEARWRRDALETARLILHDVVEAEKAAPCP